MPFSPPKHRPIGWKPAEKKREAFYGTKNWRQLRAAIVERDGHRCVRCGTAGERLFVDHIRERRDGGGEDPRNLQTLCATCHNRRHAPRAGA